VRNFASDIKGWVFERRVLRSTFGRKRAEAIGRWRKLHNEEFHNLHFLPIMMKSRRIRWAEHVASTIRSESIRCFDEKARRKETTRKILIM
jgi:hypothetical protein